MKIKGKDHFDLKKHRWHISIFLIVTIVVLALIMTSPLDLHEENTSEYIIISYIPERPKQEITILITVTVGKSDNQIQFISSKNGENIEENFGFNIQKISHKAIINEDDSAEVNATCIFYMKLEDITNTGLEKIKWHDFLKTKKDVETSNAHLEIYNSSDVLILVTDKYRLDESFIEFLFTKKSFESDFEGMEKNEKYTAIIQYKDEKIVDDIEKISEERGKHYFITEFFSPLEIQDFTFEAEPRSSIRFEGPEDLIKKDPERRTIEENLINFKENDKKEISLRIEYSRKLTILEKYKNHIIVAIIVAIIVTILKFFWRKILSFMGFIKTHGRAELLLKDTDFHVYNMKFDDVFFPSIWLNNRLKEEQVKQIITKKTIRPPFYPKLAMEIHNIGEPAKNIQGKWDLDVNGSIEKIKKMISATNLDIEIKKEEDSWVMYFLNEKLIFSSGMSHYNFSFPFIKQNNPIRIHMPSQYLCLYSFFLYLSVIQFNYSFDSPELKLYLEYSDIQENEYKKEFSIQIKIKDECINFKREFKEVLHGIIKGKEKS